MNFTMIKSIRKKIMIQADLTLNLQHMKYLQNALPSQSQALSSNPQTAHQAAGLTSWPKSLRASKIHKTLRYKISPTSTPFIPFLLAVFQGLSNWPPVAQNLFAPCQAVPSFTVPSPSLQPFLSCRTWARKYMSSQHVSYLKNIFCCLFCPMHLLFVIQKTEQ